MAFIFQNLPELEVARNEKCIVKLTIGSDILRGATVSSATGTIGTSTTPSSNTALGTALTVTSPYVLATILTSEWPASGTAAYLGIVVTLSDGRVIPTRFDLTLLW